MKLFCMIDGCPNFVRIDKSLAPQALYTCKNHTPKAPDYVHFQDYQFDPDLDSGADPCIDFGDESLTINYTHRSHFDFDDDLNEIRDLDE